MPSKTVVQNIIRNQQNPIRRRPNFVTTSAALSLTYNTHAGKIVRTTVKNLTLTLPLASSANSGEQYTVVTGTPGTTGLVLAVTSADKVNTGTSGKGIVNSGSTDAIGDSVTVVSDGSGWFTTAMVGSWAAEA